ncbi:MAG: PIN domain-containing protein [Candidatus Sulfotelmatobacter sp.]|jgi:predicted nucleic acid-binding protein
MKGIADTGFIVALARQNDEHHAWAAGLSQRITEPLLTCESVLAEAAFHLESSSYVLALLDDELLKLSFSLSNNIAQVKDLAARYADRKPDLADLCLIRMCELYPRHSLITVDEDDFRVYRKNKREVISLICPPRGR